MARGQVVHGNMGREVRRRGGWVLLVVMGLRLPIMWKHIVELGMLKTMIVILIVILQVMILPLELAIMILQRSFKLLLEIWFRLMRRIVLVLRRHIRLLVGWHIVLLLLLVLL
jgi:hypothetical protein